MSLINKLFISPFESSVLFTSELIYLPGVKLNIKFLQFFIINCWAWGKRFTAGLHILLQFLSYACIGLSPMNTWKIIDEMLILHRKDDGNNKYACFFLNIDKLLPKRDYY